MSKIIEILSGVPGCGKSARMIQSAAMSAGRYIFAVPTIDLIEEQAAYFSKLNPSAKAIKIHSKNSKKASVSRQINDLLLEPADEHIAVWITHESLLSNDFAAFTDWDICIDEPPNAITTGSIKSITSVEVFQANFDLIPNGNSEWSHLMPIRPFGNWKNTSEDVLWSKLADFLKLAERKSGVFVKAKNWDMFGSGKPIEWFSYWSPTMLDPFKTATMAGSSYLHSLGYLANETFSEKARFNETDISIKRTHQPHIKICYFTDGHTCSTTFWDSKDGRCCISKIGNWLSKYARDLGFWSGNQAVCNSLEHRIPGKLVSPKLAGLNQYRDLASCAIFYSAKAQPHDSPLYDVFELNKADVKNAREAEDIFQFVFRGAIRNPDFDGSYNIYLYSKDQADELDKKLQAHGCYHTSIEPIEEAGIRDFERPKSKFDKPRSQAELDAKEKRKKELGRLRVQRHRAKKKAEQVVHQDK